MRKISFITLIALLAVITSQVQISAQTKPVGAPVTAKATRADLAIPKEILANVKEKVGYRDRLLGYTDNEMSNFGTSDFILPVVKALFRDITAVPRYGGRVGDIFIANPADFSNTIFTGYSMLDVRAGRIDPYVEHPTDDWGVAWVPAETSIDDAFAVVLDKGNEAGILEPMTAENQTEWGLLPDPVKRLVVRVLVAAIDATPVIVESFDGNFLKSYFHVNELDEIDRNELYKFVSSPWQEDTDTTKIILPTPKEAFDALGKFDIKFMGQASAAFTRAVQVALDEYVQNTETKSFSLNGFKKCEIETVMGTVGIFGDGPDAIEGNYSFILDLGGNDTYTGSTAIPRSFSKPIGLVIDLAGDDNYDSGDLTAALACGNHGIGGIIDVEGDDMYTCVESGLGSAWYGTAFVVDFAGDDKYKSKIFSQAAAHAGIGVLIDIAGDDRYDCIEQSQAFGSTLGAGILVDAEGNDIYFADPKGNVSEIFEGRTCNFAQGTGFGRRADFGDGHNLGGGIGFIIDGAGDDSYTGSVYSQGAGYWWGLGVLEDRGGNDKYACEQYSLGSAPHFAIGCAVDLSGDDKYNVGNDAVVRQIQGHARDGSMAVFIDGSGNDEYWIPNLTAGSSDLNCLTLFWDRMGDDKYTAIRIPPQEAPFSFGDSTRYEKFNNFRDEMASTGVFLDTGGTDVYSEKDPTDADAETISKMRRIPFDNNIEWLQRDEAPNFGFGLDIAWYIGVEEPAEENQD